MCDIKDIHPLEPNMGIVCLVLNVIACPLGTWIHACLGPNPGRGIVIGILQLLLMFVFVGWVWGVIYGVRIYQSSVNNSLKTQGGYEH